MFREIGLKFSVQGLQEAKNHFEQASASFNGMANTMATNVPKISGHLNKISEHTSKFSTHITNSMNMVKAAIAGVVLAKAGGAGFNALMGDEGIAKEKTWTEQFVPAEQMNKYLAMLPEMRKTMTVETAAFIRAAYQLDSAMTAQPEQVRMNALKQLPYLALQLDTGVKEASEFYKTLMAEVEAGMTEAQKATLMEDTIAKLAVIAKTTKADPKNLPMYLSKVAPVFNELKLGYDQMLSTGALLIPKMGGHPELPGVAMALALRKGGEQLGKLAEEEYKENFAKGNVGAGKFKDKAGNILQGVPSTNYGSLIELEKNYSKMEGPLHEKAVQDMKTMNDNAALYGARVQERAMHDLQQTKNLAQYFGVYGEVMDNIKRLDPDNYLSIAQKAMGEQSNVVLSLIDIIKSGTVQQLTDAIAVANPEATIAEINEAVAKDVWFHYHAVKQASKDLSSGLAAVFHDPMVALFKEWKGLLTDITTMLDLKGPTGKKLGGKFNDFIGGIGAGFMSEVAPAKAGEESLTIAERLRNAIMGIIEGDWAATGAKFGQGVGMFVSIMKKLGEMVSWAHSALGLDKEKKIAPPKEKSILETLTSPSSAMGGVVGGFLGKKLFGAPGALLGAGLGAAHPEYGAYGMMGLGLPLLGTPLGLPLIATGGIMSFLNAANNAGTEGSFFQKTDPMAGKTDVFAPLFNGLIEAIKGIVGGDIKVNVDKSGNTTVEDGRRNRTSAPESGIPQVNYGWYD